jgi:hypothetical protein
MNADTRPPPNICPERYCFFWIPPGGCAVTTGKPFQAVDAEVKDSTFTSFPNGGCSCSLGVCTRLKGKKGEHDFYEPCEPELDADGLPHNYFTPGAKNA